MKVISSVLALSILVILTGCGSSGGDGQTVSSSKELPELNAAEAAATVDNGDEATEALTEQGGIANANTLSSVSDETELVSFDKLKFISLQQKILSKISSKETVSLNQTLNESIECTDGGRLLYTGTVTETVLSMTITYDNCKEYGTLMNGVIYTKAKGRNSGDVLTSLELKIKKDYSVTVDSSLAVKLYAGSYFNIDYTTYTNDDSYAGVMKSSLWFEEGRLSARYDDLEVEFSYLDDYYNNIYEVKNCYKAGRIYINNLTEYLDIDETYDTNCDYPFIDTGSGLESGSLEYTFSSGEKIHVEVTPYDVITSTVVGAI